MITSNPNRLSKSKTQIHNSQSHNKYTYFNVTLKELIQIRTHVKEIPI